MRLAAMTALAALCMATSACSKADEARGRRQPASSATAEAPRKSSAPKAAPSARAAAEPAQHIEPPAGYSPMHVGGVAPTAQGNAVVLTDDSKKIGVFIFIGKAEALSLALRLQKRRYSRPLTHDLLDEIMTRFGASIASVRVDKLQDDVFYGTVVILEEGRELEIDARPSDALALAVGRSAPIFVADGVIDAAGVDLRNLQLEPPEALDPDPPSDDRTGQVEL